MLGVLHQQLEAFRLKFGRDPGPGDPVFFDPASAVPAPMPDDYLERETAAAMTRAGISPAQRPPTQSLSRTSRRQVRQSSEAKNRLC